MLQLTNFISLLILLSSLIIILWTIIINNINPNQESNSQFECGFQPLVSPRLPISILFFLLGIMFLIFDIEVLLIIPLIIVINTVNTNTLLIASSWPLIMLLWAYNVWNYQALSWTN